MKTYVTYNVHLHYISDIESTSLLVALYRDKALRHTILISLFFLLYTSYGGGQSQAL